jgi:hypothetical protein
LGFDCWLGGSSSQADLIHELLAVAEGLDDQLQLPDASHQEKLATIFHGIFNGCIGISNAKESQVLLIIKIL